MFKRLAFVAAAATAIGAAAFTVPAHAYPTTMCEDNGFPREFGISDTERIVFVGVEQTTPLDAAAVGFRLCFEVNPLGPNLVGYDLGIGVFYDTSSNGLLVSAHRCGLPSESSCQVVLAPTGVGIAPGDLPAPGVACVATVASVCIPKPTISYGGDGGRDTITVWVNGIAIPVNLLADCVTVGSC